jgi:hypothetical protein
MEALVFSFIYAYVCYVAFCLFRGDKRRSCSLCTVPQWCNAVDL